MFTFLLIITGIGFVGFSLNKLFGSGGSKKYIPASRKDENKKYFSLFGADQSKESSAEILSYDSIPQPTSAKPLYIGLAVGSICASLYLIFYLVNYSQTFAGKFWLFILTIVSFVFGCVFAVLAGTADHKMAEKEALITDINRQRMERKKQEVQYANVVSESQKEAELRKMELERQRKDKEILESLYDEAYDLGIPIDSLTGLNVEKIKTKIEGEAARQKEEHKTQQDFERDINKEKVTSFRYQEKITKITGTQYKKLSAELLADIAALREQIIFLKEDKEISDELREVRIENIQESIDDKRFQLNDLRAGLVKDNYREERKGPDS